jgi:hypothetical protein
MQEDVGFVYGSVPASVKSPESISRSATEDSDKQRLAPYEATTAPGARLPHATLTAAGAIRQAATRSPVLHGLLCVQGWLLWLHC